MLARLVPFMVAGSLASGLSAAALATDISGPAWIVDGDTLLIAGETVRLQGIDAPEGAQLCYRGNDRKWPCGQRAADVLKALVGGGAVTCRGDQRDRNGWLLAVCTSASGLEVNRLLVEAGLAVAERGVSKAFDSAQSRARKAALGLWSGRFESPRDYRARRWEEAGQVAPEPDCPIKGNIDRKGNHTYLMPHSRAYGWAKIDAARGERWFCTMGEAVDAGWQVRHTN